MIPISQRDIRWRDIQLGTSDKTISQAGCTITALAYVLGTTPDIVNEKLKSGKGYTSTNLVTWSKLKSIFPEITEVRRVISYNNLDVISNLPCLIEVDGAPIGAKKHWVVYIGNRLMMDPWFGSIKDTGFYRPTGYAVIKTGMIKDEPIAQDLDIRLSILNENKIKTEGDLREVLGAYKELPVLKEDKLNADKEIERLRHLIEQDKVDLKAESDANSALKLAYEDHLQSIGKVLGNGADLPGILQAISILISKSDQADKLESQLKVIQNNNADLKADIVRKEDAAKSYSHKIDSLANELTQIKEILGKWLKIANVTPDSLLGVLRGLVVPIEKPLGAKVVEWILLIKKRIWSKQ